MQDDSCIVFCVESNTGSIWAIKNSLWW
jgi:hypothetical protein